MERVRETGHPITRERGAARRLRFPAFELEELNRLEAEARQLGPLEEKMMLDKAAALSWKIRSLEPMLAMQAHMSKLDALRKMLLLKGMLSRPEVIRQVGLIGAALKRRREKLLKFVEKGLERAA